MSERRILLVSYHFGWECPTGGFRWNATAEYMCSLGWSVDAIAVARLGLERTPQPAGPGSLEIFPVEPSHWPVRAVATLLEGARGVRGGLPGRGRPSPAAGVDPGALFVWRVGHRRPLRERVLHGLDYVAATAAELLWSGRAVRQGRSLLKTRRYRAVVVSSPPHITQRVGMRLAGEFGVPYIADYRDPWTLGLGPYIDYVTDLERIVGRYYERRSLRRAHTVIHNTERARAAVAEECAIPGEHHAIPNGYDSIGEVERPDAKCFRLVYTGHLYPFMDVRPVFTACARLRERHALDAESLRIDFVGSAEAFEGVRLADLAQAYGLGDVFVRHPRLARAEAAEFQRGAAVLLAYDWHWPIAVVSKFYEYARMKGAMLLLGNTTGALADAASKLGLRVLDPRDQGGIDRVLEEAFERWQAGALDRPNDPDGIFARSRQSERICELLERL